MLHSKKPCAKFFGASNSGRTLRNHYSKLQLTMKDAIKEGSAKKHDRERKLAEIKTVLRDKRFLLSRKLSSMLETSKSQNQREALFRAFENCWGDVVRCCQAKYGLRDTNQAMREIGF